MFNESMPNEPRHFPVIMLGIVTIFVLWFLNFFNINLPISITTRNVSGEFSVIGEGKIDAVPDTANVQASIVVADSKTADDASQKVTNVNNNIVNALTRLGVEKKDIKTTNYSVSPSYNYAPGGTNSIAGYTGNATVNITVRRQELLSQVLATATQAGANQVTNSGFTVESPEKYREEARQKAIDNAKDQAKKLAGQLGIRLGRITNIVESGPQTPQIMPYAARGALDSALKTPDIEPGSQTVTSTVTLYFETK